MKNIHVLPTDKPSKLSINCQTGLLQLGLNNRMFHDDINIYITSDEVIKDVRPHKGKWHLEKENILNKFPDYLTDLSECKLVIMTTDDDLINDGVQAIDDEFLEWFVKNPSCERVEIFEQYRKCCRNTDGTNENCIEPINCEGWLNSGYERPYKTNCDERFEGYKIIIPKEEPKQETLEEAAEKLYPLLKITNNSSDIFVEEENLQLLGHRRSFIKGAKWQQEQDKNKYSEEDLISLLEFNYKKETNQLGTLRKDYSQKIVKEWFEQFKKEVI